MTREALSRFIDGYRLAVLATINSSRIPEAALVGFAATPELEIVFDTLKSSRKYANLRGNGAVALVIGWEEEITVQYEGTATELDAHQPCPYKETYFRKWPDGTDRQKWPEIAYFAVRPRWVRYSDYNLHRVSEFTFDTRND